MKSVWINWYLEKRGNNQKPEEIKKDLYFCWKDLMTGTGYCIKKEQYNNILQAGREKLTQYLEDENLSGMEDIFYNRTDLNDDLSLFPELPYWGDSEIPCEMKSYGRIRDYVCLRTSFLYAIKYEAIMKNEDFEEAKKEIRMWGLGWPLGKQSKKYPELARIDRILRQDQEWTDGIKCVADLVKGGMVKIKQYYLETNHIPEIRGASRLLNYVNEERMQQYIEQQHIRECLIYAGGGKILGVFPQGCGEAVVSKFEVLVEQSTVTAQSNFCSHPYELECLAGKYKEITMDMDLLLEERQGLRWDFQTEPQVEIKDIIEGKENEYDVFKEKKSVLCDSCKQRNAVFILRRDKRRVCQSCLCKNLYGGRAAKRSVFLRYQAYVEEHFHESVEDRWEDYNTVGQIAESSGDYIGVIYGDANNMSKAIMQLDSFMKMKYFSEKTADTVTNIVFDALHKHLKNIPSFEIIAVGGDDIFILVPGNKAYDIACSIGKLFDERFKNQTAFSNNMTMSLGVCVTHAKMPVRYIFEVAQQLLKSAKQKAWKEQLKGNSTGTIDWMVIENDVFGGAVLEYHRRDFPNKPHRTLRPYTWKQADAIRQLILSLTRNKEKSLAFQLKQSWDQHTAEESKLFYEFQLSKKEKEAREELKRLLNEFAKNLGGTMDKHNIELENEIYSPWNDVIELLNYL